MCSSDLDVAVMCWAGKGDATDTLGPDIGARRAPLRALRRWALRRAAHVGLTDAIREELAPLLPDVEVHVVGSAWGHYAMGGFDSADIAAVHRVIADALA